MPESIKSDIRKGYRMASEQAEEKGPANRNSRAESKQGSRRKRRVLLIVIPLLLARAAIVAHTVIAPILLLRPALKGRKAAMAAAPDV